MPKLASDMSARWKSLCEQRGNSRENLSWDGSGRSAVCLASADDVVGCQWENCELREQPGKCRVSLPQHQHFNPSPNKTRKAMKFQTSHKLKHKCSAVYLNRSHRRNTTPNRMLHFQPSNFLWHPEAGVRLWNAIASTSEYVGWSVCDFNKTFLSSHFLRSPRASSEKPVHEIQPGSFDLPIKILPRAILVRESEKLWSVLSLIISGFAYD